MSGTETDPAESRAPRGDPAPEGETCGFYSKGEFCGDEADRVRELEYVGYTVEVPVCDDHNWAAFDLKTKTFPMAIALRVTRSPPKRPDRDGSHYSAHAGWRADGINTHKRLDDDALSDLREQVREEYDLSSLPVGEKGYAVFSSPTDYEIVAFDPEAGRPVVEWQAEQAAEALAAIPNDCAGGHDSDHDPEDLLDACADLADVDADDLREAYHDDGDESENRQNKA